MTEDLVNQGIETIRRLRVGLLIPSTDITVEIDLKANLPDNVSFHSSRMYLAGVTIADEERMLEEEVPRASRDLAGIEPDVAVFACTSAGALFGPEGDLRLAKQIQELIDCHVITVFGSVLRTLHLLNPKRLLILTPYTDEVNNRLRDSIEASGIAVNSICGMNIVSDLDIARVPKENILKLLDQQVLKNDPDCIFLSCTNLPAWEILSYVKEKYKVPTISSNYAMYRELLKTLGFPVPSISQPLWGNQASTCN